jgi:hypothetical protein
MRLDEFWNPMNTARNIGNAAVRPFRNAEQNRTVAVTGKTLQVLKAHLQRLQQGQVNLRDPAEYSKQIGAWATKFFKTNLDGNGYNVDATKVNAGNIKQFVKQLVGRKLAEVNLNTGRPDQHVSNTATPNTLAGTTQQQNMPHQVNPSATPVGSQIKVNGGTYSRTQQGWTNEKGQLVTNPKSIQYLEDQYKKATNTQRVV